ncbi:MAG TPA: MMPL family transporter [Gemmataceae bacterium]|nr:MMPL family transporter [Gemmataceae bacterium]
MGISLAVSLCVVLTFTAPLLRLAGSFAFWPRTIEPRKEPASQPAHDGWFWTWFGGAVARRPGVLWIAAALLLTPFAIGGYWYRDDVDYDFVRRLPPESASSIGTRALQRDFSNGAVGGITMLIDSPQLDFSVEDGKGQIELAVLTHWLAKEQTSLGLADVRGWDKPLGTGWVARQATGASLDEIKRGKQQALQYYISQHGKLKGHVTRLELTMLHNPMSRQGMETLDRLQQAIQSELYGDLRNAKIYYLGITADMRDLRHVTGNDQTFIQILVVGCVLVILLFLLRQAVVSIYLIASVLFSYFAALGAAMLFFWWLDPESFVGLDWKTPLFLFTILVAIGEDYNIFLMTRVSEEQARHGLLAGIRVAVVKTGGIITSCGIIMAGTFASLGFGTMQDLHHLGFALAFGVLVDTFLVRPILVPTFLIFLARITTAWQIVSSFPEGGERLREMIQQKMEAPQSDAAPEKAETE